MLNLDIFMSIKGIIYIDTLTNELYGIKFLKNKAERNFTISHIFKDLKENGVEEKSGVSISKTNFNDSRKYTSINLDYISIEVQRFFAYNGFRESILDNDDYKDEPSEENLEKFFFDTLVKNGLDISGNRFVKITDKTTEDDLKCLYSEAQEKRFCNY